VLDGPLDLYDTASGIGTLTTHWIEDRATFLGWKVQANTADRLFAVNPGGDNAWYRDVALNERLRLEQYRPGSESAAHLKLSEEGDAQRIFFGSDAADPLDVARTRIRIRRRGDDRLNGRGGDDYLQGDQGKDALFGGRATIRSSVARTTKRFRTAETFFDGGLGNDTYIWNKGDGFDTITDAREGGNGTKLGTSSSSARR